MIIRMLAVTLALAFGAPAHAQLYKWVDSEGKVQYSDKPPPAGASREQKLNIPKNPPAAAGPAAPVADGEPTSPQNAADKEMDFRKRKVEEDLARQKGETEERQRQDQCINAQQRLRGLEDAGRVYTVDEKGERQYLDDEARARGIEQARQDISKFCK
jgi:hypothetical protein